ncbi:MAG: hypothetical protein U0354_02750 [Candidatus Sericytochromatia bacterium]
MLLKNARNPLRRNKNIGTSKQGYRKNNRFVIPDIKRNNSYTIFYQNLKKYTVVNLNINNKEFKFVVEETKKDYIYPVTIQDVEKILHFIHDKFTDNLNLIVFRQPKRKEEIINPVWGRLIYYFEFEGETQPAIILESVKLPKKIKWNKKLRLDKKNELEFLKEDGVNFVESKRDYTAFLTLDIVRQIQLYRTFIHEIGHYNEYLEKIEYPLSLLRQEIINLENEINELSFNNKKSQDKLLEKLNDLEERYEEENILLWDKYDSIPISEKEYYANNFAKKISSLLKTNKLIPFKRILDEKFIIDSGLKISGFQE